MSLAWQGRRGRPLAAGRQEEPMEMGPLESGEVIALKARIQTLEEQLKRASGAVSTAAKSHPPLPLESNLNPNATPYTGPRLAGPKSACYECKAPSHFGHDCSIPKVCLEREAAASGISQ